MVLSLREQVGGASSQSTRVIAAIDWDQAGLSVFDFNEAWTLSFACAARSAIACESCDPPVDDTVSTHVGRKFRQRLLR